ncbi:uncharacterized protein LOC116261421 isoform X1 [Nymphaea colorata]|nr:uncharacterized protein LOC116261421 isoform X1 [Nymphaea colorata]
MGASESRQEATQDVTKDLETTVATICHLPTLRDAFTRLCHGNNDHHPPPHSDDAILLQTLKDCFSFRFKKIESKSPTEDHFLNLLNNVGEAIVDLFFTCENGQVSWIEFLKGYIRCCGRAPASESLCNLYKLHAEASRKAGMPSNLDFVSDSVDCRINGYFMLRDVLTLLWLCWIMMHDSRISKLEVVLALPEVNHLLWSVILSNNDVGSEIKPMDQGNFDLSQQVSFDKLHKWALTVVPGLSNCFTQYVNDRMQTTNSVVQQAVLEPCTQSTSDCPPKEENSSCLLTSGRAWSISLTLRNFFCEELMEACVSGGILGTSENLLYRSSIHGKGLNRFWSNIDGYQAPLLMLVAASTSDAHEDNISSRQWVIGVLVQQGFENRDVYYGSPGFIYALHPSFHASGWTGKEKNFVCSHLRATRRVYEANPRPVGIGFGGSIGNERIFIDEDLAHITVRHHAFDKTYQPGFLVPNQGFLAVEGSVLDVEVWGLGGKSAKQGQDAYKKREGLFTEQRRKVDLKTFGNWEDSPEKMLLDMVSDPNKIQREER